MINLLRHIDEHNFFRQIYYADDKCYYTVSTEEFEKLLIQDDEYTSKKAELIDEKIFCYVPKDVFKASDKQICSFIKEYIL